MIDTITIVIPAKLEHVYNAKYFGNAENVVLEHLKQGFVCKIDCKNLFINNTNLYYPILKIVSLPPYKDTFWQITFSIPKLCFGSNLYEVCRDDFDNVISILRSRIYDMGINISSDEIKSSVVWNLHIAKNIDLGDISCKTLLSAISCMAFNKRQNIQNTIFIDDNSQCKLKNRVGETFSLWTKNKEFVLYDKIAEIKNQSDNVFCDALQYNALNDYISKHPNIIRIEFRMFKKRVIDAYLDKFVKGVSNQFNNVFDDNFMLSTMLYAWNSLIKKNIQQLKLVHENIYSIIDYLVKIGKRAETILKYLGAIYCVESGYGLSNLKSIFPSKNRFLKNMEKDLSNLPVNSDSLYMLISSIDSQINISNLIRSTSLWLPMNLSYKICDDALSLHIP